MRIVLMYIYIYIIRVCIQAYNICMYSYLQLKSANYPCIISRSPSRNVSPAHRMFTATTNYRTYGHLEETRSIRNDEQIVLGRARVAYLKSGDFYFLPRRPRPVVHVHIYIQVYLWPSPTGHRLYSHKSLDDLISYNIIIYSII